MRSTISRAVVVAAAATGILALGSVAANAATLPSAPSVGSLSTVTNTPSSTTSTLSSPTRVVNGVVKRDTVVPNSAHTILTTRNLKNTLAGLPGVQHSVPGVQHTVQGLAHSLTNADQLRQPMLAHTRKAGSKGVSFAENLPTRLPANPTSLPASDQPNLPSVPGLPSTPSLPSAPSLPNLPTSRLSSATCTVQPLAHGIVGRITLFAQNIIGKTVTTVRIVVASVPAGTHAPALTSPAAVPAVPALPTSMA
jgi:hypothetical protein